MIVIIALGQEMRRDDAAGLEIVRAWQRSYPQSASRQDVHVEIARLAGLDLLNLLEDADAAVLVDCVHTNASAGTLFTLQESDLEQFSTASGSAHGWGAAETLALGRVIGDDLPNRLAILAIAAGEVGIGEGLSPAVLAAIPAAAKKLENILQSLS